MEARVSEGTLHSYLKSHCPSVHAYICIVATHNFQTLPVSAPFSGTVSDFVWESHVNTGYYLSSGMILLSMFL